MKQAARTLMIVPIILLLALFVAAAPPSDSTLPNPDGSMLPSSNAVYLRVSAVGPEQNIALPPGAISFSASLANTSRVTGCTLIISGSNQGSSAPLGSSITLSKTFTAAQEGNYLWYIRCTDGTLTNQSITRTINISADAQPLSSISLSLDNDKTQYFPGDTLTLNGADLSALASNVKVFLRKNTTTIKTITIATLSTGTFSQELMLALSSASGEYHFYVENQENKSQNGTINFVVVLPNSSLSVDAASIVAPDSVRIVADNFLKEKPVTFLMRQESLVLVHEDIVTNSNGRFTYYYDIPKNASAGNVTLEAQQKNNSLINATTQFVIIIETNTSNTTNTTFTFYRDADGDGYGVASLTRTATSAPAGYVANSDDCDDTTASIKPGASESCDNRDNDCDGTIDNGNLCSSGEECSAGQCVAISTGTNTVNTGNTGNTDSKVDNNDNPGPGPITDDVTPDFREIEEGGMNIWWFLIPLLLVVLFVGGLVGFVAYEGYLDTTSVDGFVKGIKLALGLEKEKPRPQTPLSKSPFGDITLPGENVKTPSGLGAAGPSGLPSSGDASTRVPDATFSSLQSFINGERKRGYDDLTIRNALLKKGWKESDVDGVFDKMYQE